MEACLGVYGRQLFVRVDCNFGRVRTCVVGAMLCYIIRFMAVHVISENDD